MTIGCNHHADTISTGSDARETPQNIEDFLEVGTLDACGASPAARTDLPMRPHCLATEACQAKGAGHCRRCWGKKLQADTAADPKVEQRRRKAVARALEKKNAERWQDPSYRAHMCEVARVNAVLLRPESRLKRNSAAARAKALATGRCGVSIPVALVPEYRELKHKVAVPATDLRLMLLAEQADRADTEEARAVRAIAEFDREQRLRHARQKAQEY